MSSSKIKVTASGAHVEKLAKVADPVGAVIELVWNSLDADAENVTVTLMRNDLDGIEGVRVSDDGHGMPIDRVRTDFKWIDNSWKNNPNVRSIGKKRALHGKAGQGRFRAFALGSSVSWLTTSESVSGGTETTRVSAGSGNFTQFTISKEPTSSAQPGTVFESNGGQKLNALGTDKALDRITSEFAYYLRSSADTITVKYDGKEIDPNKEIKKETPITLDWTFEGHAESAQLQIVEWKTTKASSLHLCDADGIPVDEPKAPQFPEFSYSAYVQWEKMPEHKGEWILNQIETENTVFGTLLGLIKRSLNDHFENEREQLRDEAVARWTEDGSYPYSGEPNSEEEVIERGTFNYIATEIRQQLPKKQPQVKLTLGLIKQALNSKPEQMATILEQLVDLTPEQVDEFKSLLDRTALSNLIAANTRVTDRLSFLSALEKIVYDPDLNQTVNERDHLHKMLEGELWIFGEQFNLMASEKGLTEALNHHEHLLGRPSSKKKKPVLKLDGKRGRLDLLLSAKTKEVDRTRHLVVELKSPGAKATSKEVDQIKKYATAIADEPRFHGTPSQWDFYLIVNEADKFTEQDRLQENRPRGLISSPTSNNNSQLTYRIWVKTWAEILEEASSRLDYYKTVLKLNPSLEESKKYLADKYGDLLPKVSIK